MVPGTSSKDPANYLSPLLIFLFLAPSYTSRSRVTRTAFCLQDAYSSATPLSARTTNPTSAFLSGPGAARDWPPTYNATLRPISWLTVEGERPSSLTTDRIDLCAATPWISPRVPTVSMPVSSDGQLLASSQSTPSFPSKIKCCVHQLRAPIQGIPAMSIEPPRHPCHLLKLDSQFRI